MAVNPISTENLFSDAAAAGAMKSLGKDDFLMLLIAQLANQDPLDPVDNGEFVAQLAQFSSLEGINNMSSGMDRMAESMAAMSRLSAPSFIGKTVAAQGNTVALEANDNTVNLAYQLPGAAALVTVTVYDEHGSPVRTIERGVTPPGSNMAVWDGRDSSGARLTPGKYTFAVVATAPDGTEVAAKTVTTGVVDGVSYENGVPYLMLGAARVGLNDILEIWAGQ